MHIVADENIPLVTEFFSSFGSIERLPGRKITAVDVKDADILLVRSVTQVDCSLLEGSRVRFVGTCTIGTDHLDLDYLDTAGIAWASAPGCNARGVVDYVLGSLLSLADAEGVDLSTRKYGVIGAGQVGGRLAEMLARLGWDVLVCDPPRAAREGREGFASLEQVIAESDVISLHTPLHKDGAYPTWHLFDQQRLARLKPGCWLINASRGAVVDNQALRARLMEHPDALKVVLDVWEGEPEADVDLAALCHLATPHIAGYSLDGKLRGTALIHQALCSFLGTEPNVCLNQLMPPPWLQSMTLSPGADPAWAMKTLCRAVYDPREDDARFRRSLLGDIDRRRERFDQLRKHYPLRREIEGLTVTMESGSAELTRVIRALGVLLRR